MTLTAGTKLGPYEVIAPLGAGGMGEVYRAKDTRLKREVAVKVLPASFAEDADRLRRFELEAEAAGALNHPNITAVYDVGQHDGAPYVVQELLEGETLRSALAGGPLPPRKAIHYSLQIAHGLAAAHEKGIVHRDLKPENLFVTADGRVKILDFGLAKLAHPDSGSGVESKLVTQTAGTEPGVVMGTLGYMSPEQVRGKPADARSDIFSFGAILFEMLSGRRPFRGDSAADTISAILREDPPELSVTNQSIPPGLERIVRHCLEKNPEQRFHSAHDLAFDLEALSNASGQSSVLLGWALPRALPRRLLAAGAVAAALAVGVFAGTRLAGGKSGAASFRRLTFRHGNVLSARFAQDGQTVVYGAAWEGKPAEIFSARIDSTESRSEGVGHADVLSISSKGELALKLKKGFFLGTAGTGTLARMPLGGSVPREVLEDVLRADWAPNGEDMAVLRRTAEGKLRLEYPIGHALGESLFFRQVRVSPSGDLVAYVEGGTDNRAVIGVIDRKGEKRTLVQSAIGRGFGGLAWSRATGEIFYAAVKTAADRELRAVSLSGKERVLLSSGGGSLELKDVAADGLFLLERSTSSRGLSCLAPGETRERELGWLDGSDLLDLSEDGRTILFGETGEGGGARGGVFLRKTDGSPAVRLGDGDPQALSPDGKWALSLTHTSPQELELLPTGPGSPKKVPIEGIKPIWAKFLPDGRIVFVHALPGQLPLLAFVGLDGGRPTNVVVPGVSATGGSAFSPDSKLVAYATREHRVNVVPLAGGPPRVVPGAILEPHESLFQWSADGRSLFTVRSDDIPARISRLDIETGKRTLWKEVQPSEAAGLFGFIRFRMTRDGRSYAYSYDRIDSDDLYLVEGLK